MLGHGFGVRAIVGFRPSYRWLLREEYAVICLQPPGDDGKLQDRLKPLIGGQERVTSENWLREAFAGRS
jgi:hypothetical protein